MVLAEPGGVRLGDAQQGIGGDVAGAAVGHCVVADVRLTEMGPCCEIAPFFLVAIVLAGVNVWFQTHGSGEVVRSAGFVRASAGGRRSGVVLSLQGAFAASIWPLFIRSGTSRPAIRCGGCRLLAALAVTAVLWWYRKGWSRPFLFAWGFFCVSLVPVMGFTDVGFMKYSLVADHYQHIAIIGVIALAAAGWSIWHRLARIRMRLGGDCRCHRGVGSIRISDLAAKRAVSRRHDPVSGHAGKKSRLLDGPQ